MSEADDHDGVAVGLDRSAGGRTLRFTGGRFTAERLCDEAFAAASRSLVAFRKAVVALAEHEYEAGGERTGGDVPATISGFRFCVCDFGPGSLAVEVRPDDELKMFTLDDPCLQSADRIETAIAELAHAGNRPTLSALPTRLLGKIAAIGEPLNDREAVSFESRRGTARLGQHECDELREQNLPTGVAPELIAGRVLRISADKSRAAVKVLGWQSPRPTSIYYRDLATIDDMRVALTENERNGPLVTVEGTFSLSAAGVKSRGSAFPLRDVRVHDEDTAEEMNALVSELDELEELSDGWYGTDGVAGDAPNRAAVLGVRCLTAAFPHYGLPYPHVFPCVNGGVSMEWSLDDIEASITFNDSSHVATVASLDISTDEHQYQENVSVSCAFVRDWLRGLMGHGSR